MSAIVWNRPEDKTYESGLDRGVFFTAAGVGSAWNGLVSVDQQTDGGEVEPLYFDGKRFLNFVASAEFRADMTAYSAPAAFLECEGIREIAPGLLVPHQPRKTFGLSYRTGLGNELEGDDYGYKIHLVWNITATTSGFAYQTRGESVELSDRTWSLDAVAPNSTTFKPTAHIEISSVTTPPAVLQWVEDRIYGSAALNSQLPTQAQVIARFQAGP